MGSNERDLIVSTTLLSLPRVCTEVIVQEARGYKKAFAYVFK
jgi:hypothetical protein